MSDAVIITAIVCFTLICMAHMAIKASIIENEASIIENEKEVTKNDDQS